MRKAEITLLSILYFIVTTLVGAYVEKEYQITTEISEVIDVNTTSKTVYKSYPKIILTDK